jgi:hypothetical protein
MLVLYFVGEIDDDDDVLGTATVSLSSSCRSQKDDSPMGGSAANMLSSLSPMSSVSLMSPVLSFEGFSYSRVAMSFVE